MKLPVLTFSIFIYCAYSVTASNKQPGIMDVFSQTIEGFTPCLPSCLLKNIQKSYDSLAPCVIKAVNDIEKFVNTTSFTSYSDFYEKVLVNKDGPSLFCRYYDEVTHCFDGALTNLCGQAFGSSFKALYSGLRSYANCEGDMLPILQCLAHPDICVPGSAHHGYPKCVSALVDAINDKYLIKGVFYWDHFYRQAIVKEDGKGFRLLLMDFGSCIDNIVVSVSGCDDMRYKVLDQFKAIRKFVDYRNTEKGTDSLKCFGNSSLHLAYTKCYSRLREDLVFSPPPVFPDTTLANIHEYVGLPDVWDNWPVVLLWMRNHYLSFDTCIRTSTERHCDFLWSTKEIRKILKPTDDFFTRLRPAVEGPDCQGASASGSGGSGHPWVIHLVIMATICGVINR